MNLLCRFCLFKQLWSEDSVVTYPTFHTSEFLQSAIIVSLIPVRDTKHDLKNGTQTCRELETIPSDNGQEHCDVTSSSLGSIIELQSHTLTFTPNCNSETPVNPTCMSAQCGKKQEPTIHYQWHKGNMLKPEDIKTEGNKNRSANWKQPLTVEKNWNTYVLFSAPSVF